MTPEQKQLVKSSWDKVKPISQRTAALFYGRLFEVYPEVKPMFKGDMAEQGRMLMSMINTAVQALDNLDSITAPLRNMGARHAGYGVRDGDYDKVADALLWTLEQGLQDDFTAEVKDAWAAVYGLLAGVMQEGATAA